MPRNSRCKVCWMPPRLVDFPEIDDEDADSLGDVLKSKLIRNLGISPRRILPLPHMMTRYQSALSTLLEAEYAQAELFRVPLPD
jgi:hypothetical protein